MSIALWPVFADGIPHGLIDEGAVVLGSPATDRLLEFDAYPTEVPPGFNGSPEDLLELVSTQDPTWYDPTDAMTVIDAIRRQITDAELDHALAALREVLHHAAERGTRFHFTVA